MSQDLSFGTGLLFTSSNSTLPGTYVVFLQSKPSFLQIPVVQGMQSSISIDGVSTANYFVFIPCPEASKWLFKAPPETALPAITVPVLQQMENANTWPNVTDTAFFTDMVLTCQRG